MATHKCCECKWLYTLIDSSDRPVELCIFDQSDNYLQEVGACSEDCELDGFAEELWELKMGD